MDYAVYYTKGIDRDALGIGPRIKNRDWGRGLGLGLKNSVIKNLHVFSTIDYGP